MAGLRICFINVLFKGSERLRRPEMELVIEN